MSSTEKDSQDLLLLQLMAVDIVTDNIKSKATEDKKKRDVELNRLDHKLKKSIDEFRAAKLHEDKLVQEKLEDLKQKIEALKKSRSILESLPFRLERLKKLRGELSAFILANDRASYDRRVEHEAHEAELLALNHGNYRYLEHGRFQDVTPSYDDWLATETASLRSQILQVEQWIQSSPDERRESERLTRLIADQEAQEGRCRIELETQEHGCVHALKGPRKRVDVARTLCDRALTDGSLALNAEKRACDVAEHIRVLSQITQKPALTEISDINSPAMDSYRKSFSTTFKTLRDGGVQQELITNYKDTIIGLRNYINRVEELHRNNKSFNVGFYLFGETRAKNREVNFHLAKKLQAKMNKLILQGDSVGLSILFRNETIKTMREDVIRDNHFSPTSRIGFLYDFTGVNSSELNEAIYAGRKVGSARR